MRKRGLYISNFTVGLDFEKLLDRTSISRDVVFCVADLGDPKVVRAVPEEEQRVMVRFFGFAQ